LSVSQWTAEILPRLIAAPQFNLIVVSSRNKGVL